MQMYKIASVGVISEWSASKMMNNDSTNNSDKLTKELFENLDNLQANWPKNRSVDGISLIVSMVSKLDAWITFFKAVRNKSKVKSEVRQVERVCNAFKGLCKQNAQWPSDLDPFINNALDSRKLFSKFKNTHSASEPSEEKQAKVFQYGQ